jgi:hypothetical protein
MLRLPQLPLQSVLNNNKAKLVIVVVIVKS